MVEEQTRRYGGGFSPGWKCGQAQARTTSCMSNQRARQRLGLMREDWSLQANAMTHDRRVETNRHPADIERAIQAAKEACKRAEKQYVDLVEMSVL